MDIKDLKKALLEVRHLCRSKHSCKDCEFNTGEWYCPMRVYDLNGDSFAPEDWDIDEWWEAVYGSQAD